MLLSGVAKYYGIFEIMLEITKKLSLFIALISVLLLEGCATPGIAEHTDKCVKLGQEWSYDTRVGEENSRITIVDAFINKDKRRFYVVRVTGVKIDEPNFKNYFPDGVPYFMISERGLNATLKSLLGEAKWNKYYDQYYQQWRKELTHPDDYGLTIKDKLNTIEELLNTRLGA